MFSGLTSKTIMLEFSSIISLTLHIALDRGPLWARALEISKCLLGTCNPWRNATAQYLISLIDSSIESIPPEMA